VAVSDKGTGQGAVISPLLANIYLHYVLDLWAERWRRREATGDMIIVRYADDIIVGFEHEADARALSGCHARAVRRVRTDATSGQDPPIEFGRHAAANRERRGLGKPETFNFLGFTFICGKVASGQVPPQEENPARPHAGRSCKPSSRSCGSAGTSRSRSRGNG